MGLIKKTFRRTVVRPAKRTVRRKVTRPARRKAEHATSFECPTCHKRYTNPLTHVCTVKTDFKQRAAAEKRRQATEARRARKAATRARQREAARTRKKAAADRRKGAAAARRQQARTRPAPRPRAPQHEYRLCRDEDCRRLACIAFREGIESCPRFHGEG